MNKKLLTIGETAELLGVSIDTLRRWEKENILLPFRPSPASNRYYKRDDIDHFLGKDTAYYSGDIAELAKNWAYGDAPKTLPSSLYCETSDTFYARLQRMELEIGRVPELKDIFPLVVAIIGEIGNNSYNHNLGNWPDVPGTFFGYDINKRQAVLADRGRGIYSTLKRVAPELKNDEDAVAMAFTKYISGRAPEDRGNGLKFVKDVVIANPLHLIFFTGDAMLELERNNQELIIKKTDASFHGCIAIINF